MARTTSRQRLTQAAMELFAAQGITETTTKQIAEAAEVNEATLFRQFGNKNGLLLAVLNEGDLFQRLIQRLIHEVDQQEPETLKQVLLDYAIAFLKALDRTPELVRSLIGEAGRYSDDNRVALGQGFNKANQCIADYFVAVLTRSAGQNNFNQTDIFADGSNLSAQDLASLLHTGLLGYATIELTSSNHYLWPNQDAFLEQFVSRLCSPAVFISSETISDFSAKSPLVLAETSTLDDNANDPMQVLPASAPDGSIADLPATLVHEILLRAKKRNIQDYAILYTLFAAGITPQELVRLQRIHHISDRHQHILQVIPTNFSQPNLSQPNLSQPNLAHSNSRQVPINQWIMGKRYGTYQKNPLTQWLKSRKDESRWLFLSSTLGDAQEKEPENEPMPIVLVDIETLWQDVTGDLITLTGRSPHLSQIQQTWCVDLLMRGVHPDNMQILTGWPLEQLTPYVERAKEKAAIEQVMELDKKS
ncbi:MAG: TetR/AcrR family transcriptional regulator [Cyanobacteria bacterium P01_F01_bin.150]